ncbi:hypothetical protein D6D24_06797 [Aureobasidium pullulans]|uniref:Uncharacterized protein n=1 Tax=Aureobasidium pullulans TaxID=5580 RepID=A0A4S8VNM1_AURPU|nr:hypothetical protein D6D24_06797 [Aureobasidium pullulans]
MAMEGARYTIEQLKALRESPLVRKPDELPSIDEWIEGSQQQSQQENGGRKPRNQAQRQEEPAPMGNFSSQRPSLLQTRHTSRSAQQPGTSLTTPTPAKSLQSTDEIVLGPPKTSFASSRNINKLEEREQEQESPAAAQRSRFFRDRETTKTGNNRDWRSSKQQQEDDDAFAAEPRFTPRQPREGNGNGFGQRFDQRWSRDNNDRDRERERERERERPSQRGGWRDKARNERQGQGQDASEKEPEWMDEPLEKENKNQMHTQEDFEQWKERMKASNAAPAETKQDTFDEVATPVKSTPAHSKPQTPLVTDAPGFDKSIFGSWGESKRLESPVDTRTTKTPAAGKGKSSRFASMFAPKEEARPVVEEAASPAPLESNEDKAGFLRIMAGLRRGPSHFGVDSPIREQDGRGPPAGPPPGFGVQAPQDALAAMFDKAPASTQSPRPQSGFATSDSYLPPPSQFSRPTSNVASPDPSSMRSGNPASHLPHQMQNIFLDQAPRNGSTPETFNQQHSRKQNSLNKDSEFLLNLIQTKNANRAAPPPRNQHEPEPFQLFLDQPPKTHTQTIAPKPQAPRPTESIEEQLFRGNQHLSNIDHGRPRAPPGFIEDPSIVLQQAQRSYPNGPPQPRRQSAAQQMPNTGPGAPQDFSPNFPYMSGGPPPPGPGDRMPPPGFNPNLRHPPGFANIPNIFQQPGSQPPPQQGGMQGPPPGFPPGMALPPPGFGGHGPPPPGFFNNPNHMPGVPPGFAPPGMMIMPGSGVRSPEGTPGMRSPQEGPGVGMPMLQGMGAAYGGRR